MRSNFKGCGFGESLQDKLDATAKYYAQKRNLIKNKVPESLQDKIDATAKYYAQKRNLIKKNKYGSGISQLKWITRAISTIRNI